ncbi:MAG: serine hydrolase [Bacillota bacterium]
MRRWVWVLIVILSFSSGVSAVVKDHMLIEDARIRFASGPVPAELSAYLAQRDGTYGVYYWDLGTGETFGVNHHERFFAASTIKVPVVLYAVDMAWQGRLDLSTLVTYLSSDYEAGSGYLKKQAPGGRYSILQLATFCFRYSDNVAVNMLVRTFGYNTLRSYWRSLGGRMMYDGQNVTSPYSMAQYWHRWLCLSREYDAAQELLSILGRDSYRARMIAGLPAGVRFWRKTGTWKQVANDTGIVFSDPPYIITIYSRGAAPEYEEQTLAGISRIIYAYHAKKHNVLQDAYPFTYQ